MLEMLYRNIYKIVIFHPPPSKRQKISDEENIVPDPEEIDRQVQELLADSETESEKNMSDNEEAVETEEQLLENLEILPSNEETGPNSSDPVANAINIIWKFEGTKDNRKTLLSKYKRPGNCDLIVKTVNPEIWSESMLSSKRSQDIKHQKVLTNITTASSATATMAEKLVQLQTEKDMSAKDMRKNLKDVIQTFMDVISILAGASQEQNEIRRNNIKPSLGKTIMLSPKMCQ